MPAPLNIGDSRVLESREVGDGKTIRRRREAPDGRRFTTYERIEKPNLAVIKKDGSRELFDRDKLAGAIKQSVGKFFSSEVEVEEIWETDEVVDTVVEPGMVETRPVLLDAAAPLVVEPAALVVTAPAADSVKFRIGTGFVALQKSRN